MSTDSAIQEAGKSSSGFTKGQSWGALRKLWTGYRVAKIKGEMEKMREYANKIRKVQGELGISVASFPNLGIN